MAAHGPGGGSQINMAVEDMRAADRALNEGEVDDETLDDAKSSLQEAIGHLDRVKD